MTIFKAYDILIENEWGFFFSKDYPPPIRNQLIRRKPVFYEPYDYFWKSEHLIGFSKYEPEKDLLTAALNYLKDFPEARTHMKEICLRYNLLNMNQISLVDLFL